MAWWSGLELPLKRLTRCTQKIKTTFTFIVTGHCQVFTLIGLCGRLCFFQFVFFFSFGLNMGFTLSLASAWGAFKRPYWQWCFFFGGGGLFVIDGPMSDVSQGHLKQCARSWENWGRWKKNKKTNLLCFGSGGSWINCELKILLLKGAKLVQVYGSISSTRSRFVIRSRLLCNARRWRAPHSTSPTVCLLHLFLSTVCAGDTRAPSAIVSGSKLAHPSSLD